MPLRFAEELLLLVLNEDHGGLAYVSERHLDYALAGAVLTDLALENRIDTDPETEKLVLVDPASVGDDLLDPALTEVAQEEETHEAGWWVRRLARDGGRIRERVLARLVEAGIVTSTEESAAFVAPSVRRSRRYPLRDGTAEQEVRLRIMGILFRDDVPDPRDVVIIGLADACGLFERLLTSAERREVGGRLEVVRRMDLIGRAVASAVRESARDAAVPAARGEIPFAAGLPVLGSALEAAGDFSEFLARQYRTLGPVFGIRLLHKRIVVLAGAEANRFLNRQGRLFLRNYEPWHEFGHELEAARTVLSMDGRDHVRTRQAFAPAFSRTYFRNHLDDADDITRRHVEAWSLDGTVRALPAMQRLVADQTGTIMASVSAREHVEDLIFVLETLLTTRVMKQLPRFLAGRRFRKARARLLDGLARKTLDAHRPGGPLQDAGDLVNDVIDLHRTDPQLMPETDMKAMVLSPYLAGIETVASASAFALYAVLKHPDLTERARAEADALFAAGPPTAEGLRRLDVTHRTVLEALRRYPTTPVVLRAVANSFEFGGYRIAAGQPLFVATTVTHRLAEHFPDPERFDIDRYLPERAEHRQPHVFVPFGVGTHTCLGGGFAEAQILLTLAVILHAAELTIDPPGYELKMTSVPVPRPAKRFRLKVKQRRRPSASQSRQ